ncbi:FAD-dependent pyridine nucleotide-disulphide oxidoreductase [Penicillium camemberti]|uniref:FAD-dependent pyridine nucleotide-disulphide oxidoreductase n=1 Tax=Penicillium camemberti (strain FM 013) TaxID=1429867 RepID=A0A0G4P6Y3_PENC3|nr:FAD-dependent pyridine nucleotide-disulphide oxidoreductase [Penicillium camemberti]
MATPDIQQNIPSHIRGVPGSVNIPVARFPVPSKTIIREPEQIASNLVNAFNLALAKREFGNIASLFGDNGFWRDHLALSWQLRTVQGHEPIVKFLEKCSESRDGMRLQKISIDRSTSIRAPKVCALDGAGEVQGIQFFFTAETAHGSAVGVARLALQNDVWKIYTLFTALKELKGHEELLGHRRPKGAEHGGHPDRKNWAEKRADFSAYTDGHEPSVLIIGAGQGGLTAAARLKMLGVDSLIIDKNESVGDNWRLRYRQLVLHDPVWYDHMPYMEFPANWPIFTPKDKLAEFFECYVKMLELNVWNSTAITQCEWDEKNANWIVNLSRQQKNGTTEVRTFRPRHIIQATGHSGKMKMPQVPGMKNFQGELLCHSSQFPGAQRNGHGKKAIVVGSCNSAHDIAQDYQEKGYHITMVQRSTTCIISSAAIRKIGLRGLYEEDGPPVADADLLLHGTPTPVMKALQIHITAQEAEHDKELLDGLAKAGFKVDRGPNGAGLFVKYFQRGGGYYIDVGASQMIVDGKIKVKQGQEIAEVLPRGLKFADGSELEADEIIFATGYDNMRSETRTILGDKVADKVSDVWGYNNEGEVRTMWQDSGHPGFYFHGGNLATARYYSKVLALQIKALEEGIYRYGEF